MTEKDLDKDVEFLLSFGSVDEKGAGPPRKRAKNVKYTSAQKELVKKCVLEEGLGYKAILKKFPDWGFNEYGLRTMVERIRSTGTIFRKEGSGRPRTQRTAERIDLAKSFMEANQDATLGDLAEEADIKRAAARPALQVCDRNL